MHGSDSYKNISFSQRPHSVRQTKARASIARRADFDRCCDISGIVAPTIFTAVTCELFLLDALVPEATKWLQKHHRVLFQSSL